MLDVWCTLWRLNYRETKQQVNAGGGVCFCESTLDEIGNTGLKRNKEDLG